MSAARRTGTSAGRSAERGRRLPEAKETGTEKKPRKAPARKAAPARLAAEGAGTRPVEPVLQPPTGTVGEIVAAEMVLWRVLGCSNDYADRPDAWSTTAQRGPGTDDQVAVHIGALPDELTATVRQWRAQSNGILDQLFGGATFEQRVARYAEDLATVELPEFENPYPSWLTIRLSRRVRVRASQGRTLAWLVDPDAAMAVLEAFDSEAGPYLDGVMAQLFALPPGLNLGAVRYSDRRAFLTAPGRAPLRQPRVQMSVNDAGVIVGTAWATAPVPEIEALVDGLPQGAQAGRLASVPARWLTEALAEEDEIRRFVFAFAGLETLATLAEKHARERLTERLALANPTLPVKELLWPSKTDDFADRNLAFRFAAMAAVYSPSSTAADLAAFSKIAKVRNALFHGSDNSVDRDLSIACLNLLRRYIGLVAAET